MILSPYRNPPYRSPTPTSSQSPQTPKWKRSNHSEDISEPVGLVTSVQNEDANNAGAKSPRTKMADKLRGLNIQQPVSPSREAKDPRPISQRKRHRRMPPVRDASPTPKMPELIEESDHDESNTTTNEVEETPDCRTKQLPQLESSSPSASPSRPIAYVEITPPNRKRLKEAQLSPNASLLSPNATLEPIERSASPLPCKGNLTPDQAALTWQDHEITGHEIDPSGEDDGEGINGIGFRPTAAIAAARQSRRRQQVSEWKAREARDARQKRFERRKVDGASGGGRVEDRGEELGSSPSGSRMVRFVGTG